MIAPHRRHPLWFAYIVHRLSGLTLALFLPVHFYLLSWVITRPEDLNRFFTLSEHPLVKVAEFGLIFLLGVHLFGGLRLMALEFLPWSGRQKTAAAAAVALSLVVSGVFLMQAV